LSAVLLACHAAEQVLIDLNMPVMNGFETLAQIKSSPVLKHIPVILMSSDDGRAAGSTGT
jgi:CheY-like chemotaxis protein